MKEPGLLCSIRFLFSIMCFFLNVIHYMQRNNISVAIICMVTNKNCLMNDHSTTNSSLVTHAASHSISSYQNSTSLNNLSETLDQQCSVIIVSSFITKQLPTYFYKISILQKNTLNWSKQLQGIILGSIYVGYILSQVIGSWFALIIGPKLLLFLATIISSVLSILTPVAANYSYIALIALRFTMGLAQVKSKLLKFQITSK